MAGVGTALWFQCKSCVMVDTDYTPTLGFLFFSSQCLVWKEGGFTNPTGESKDEREGGRREGRREM